MTTTPRYRLVAGSHVALGPVGLDPDQQQVVDHRGGPLLVLAGPGTGKTTTLVEAIVARIEAGADPGSVLALTFSRKAAHQLRDRVNARLGRTISHPVCATFHSFAYAVLRRYLPTEGYLDPVRLLSAAEQDLIIRELLARPRSEEGPISWPPALAAALGTRGFAREVASVVARTQERGLGFERLARLGAETDRPEWIAAADFMEQYDAVLGGQGLLDYAGLIAQTVALLQDPASPARADLRRALSHVFVDEYQDTDPAQVALLKAIAGDGRNLIVVGDPHQSIYGFRGADLRGITMFPEEFRTEQGAEAPVVALVNTRRYGRRIAAVAARLQTRMGLAGSAAVTRLAMVPAEPVEGVPEGRVRALVCDSERAEAEHIADLLRRAHLDDGVPWSAMAVLVRSGRDGIPVLGRALQAAGVPIEVAADEVPIARAPAVQPLLVGLRAAGVMAEGDPDGWLDGGRVKALLTSPLGGLDAADLRVLGRLLRETERGRASIEGRDPRGSDQLLVSLIREPGEWRDLSRAQQGPSRASALAGLLSEAAEQVREGAAVEQVLWRLWSQTSWPARLRAATQRGGTGARLAHRDLDAILALFEAAERAESQRGHLGVEAFLEELEGQQIPADTLAERGVRGDAVRLLTAHRSKGLEWDLVIVAGVQEDTFPDVRRRISLLHADEIGHRAVQSPPTRREQIAEERRLFYVACTRARRALVVTAVASSDDDGPQPSRFLEELGVPVETITGRPPHPLSLTGLVAELRRTVQDDHASAALRQAAAWRLARLAEVEVGGRRVVPGADPDQWWGNRRLSEAAQPLRPTDEPLPVSASMLTAVTECPTRWFLEREAEGRQPSSQAQGFGNVAHAIADRISRGDLSADVTRLDEVMAQVDEVWSQLPFRTPWSQSREREALQAALRRFLSWHLRAQARPVVATEQPFTVTCRLPDESVVVLRGTADRLELDNEGRLVVVDLKTGKYPAEKIAEHPQLGLYQLAVAEGGFAEVAGEGREPGGAELWQLRQESRGLLKIQSQPPPQADEEGWLPVQRLLAEATGILRSERLSARPGKQCERCPFDAFCPATSGGTVLQ